jgi:hypothetical protein
VELKESSENITEQVKVGIEDVFDDERVTKEDGSHDYEESTELVNELMKLEANYKKLVDSHQNDLERMEPNTREYNSKILEQIETATTYDIAALNLMERNSYFAENIDASVLKEQLLKNQDEHISLRDEFHANDLPPFGGDDSSSRSSSGSFSGGDSMGNED